VVAKPNTTPGESLAEKLEALRAFHNGKAIPSEPAVDPEHWLGTKLRLDWADDRVLDRMLMYERRIESSLYRTMVQLQRLRLMRKLEAEAEAGASELGARGRRSTGIPRLRVGRLVPASSTGVPPVNSSMGILPMNSRPSSPRPRSGRGQALRGDRLGACQGLSCSTGETPMPRRRRMTSLHTTARNKANLGGNRAAGIR